NRELHGALLDSQILAEVHLIMTGGQARLSLGGHDSNNSSGEASAEPIRRLAPDRPALKVIRASGDELAAHEAKLGGIARASEQGALWLQLEQDSAAEH